MGSGLLNAWLGRVEFGACTESSCKLKFVPTGKACAGDCAPLPGRLILNVPSAVFTTDSPDCSWPIICAGMCPAASWLGVAMGAEGCCEPGRVEGRGVVVLVVTEAEVEETGDVVVVGAAVFVLVVLAAGVVAAC